MHVQTTDEHRVAMCIKKSYDGDVYQPTNHLAYVTVSDPHKTPTKLFSPCFLSFLALFWSLGVASSYQWLLCDSISAHIICTCKDLWKMNKNIQISFMQRDVTPPTNFQTYHRTKTATAARLTTALWRLQVIRGFVLVAENIRNWRQCVLLCIAYGGSIGRDFWRPIIIQTLVNLYTAPFHALRTGTFICWKLLNFMYWGIIFHSILKFWVCFRYIYSRILFWHYINICLYAIPVKMSQNTASNTSIYFISHNVHNHEGDYYLIM